VTVEIAPVPGIPEVRPGDDLGSLIAEALRGDDLELRPGDVVAVTQKVVSKAEGRVVPEGPGGKAGWVASESRRIVARRGDLVIAETSHGFVCANAGVDASNVAEGFLTLLPEDPDASAERIRTGLAAATGSEVAVVVTDTFGRPWREGLVNVAIGCAGLPALVDLRGTKDATGRVLEATVEAMADQVAAASGLVMGKADGVPVAIVRGLSWPAEARWLGARALARPADEDLFRESPLQGLHSLVAAERFGAGEVPRAALEEAVMAACAAPGPEGQAPWMFLALWPGATRRRLLALAGNTDDLLKECPVAIVPLARPPVGDAERETLLLAAGAAIQNLMLALHAQSLASRWVPWTPLRHHEALATLELPAEWIPLGVVAVGRPSGGSPAMPEPFDPGEFLRFVE
jgi:dehydro coenzyme F420 reductase / coenzyme F420-0:L-glutamate ligase / coenzyme F420-1:gamma-L-glutamate ligase